MNRFIIKSAVAVVFILMVHLVAIFTADGTIDAFYLRFNTGRQSSLILGTSRAAQTFQPKIINATLAGSAFELPIFNFSFTLMNSPFGPVYLKAIKNKLNPSTKRGLFIVAVDPWSVSANKPDPNNVSLFRENGKLLDRVSEVNGKHPNWNYFLNLGRGIGTLYTAKIEYALTKSKLLHADGWLEITVPMDTASVEKRIKDKVAMLKQDLDVFQFSKARFNYLKLTAETLKKYGTVVLVRLPVSEGPLAVENALAPSFDEMIDSLAKENNIQFINYQKIKGNYLYTDGSHLHKTTGAFISRDVAECVLKAVHSR